MSIRTRPGEMLASDTKQKGSRMALVGNTPKQVRTSVLVVDDEASVRGFLARCLAHWGYAVREAGSAVGALEAMFTEPASVILCDIRMPGHDGLWLVERVLVRWPQTAVIMATGVMDIPTVVKSQQLGAVDYVTKPFGTEMLLQALRRATSRDSYSRRR